jgi:hypothetical protein
MFVNDLCEVKKRSKQLMQFIAYKVITLMYRDIYIILPHAETPLVCHDPQHEFYSFPHPELKSCDMYCRRNQLMPQLHELSLFRHNEQELLGRKESGQFLS